MISCCKNYMIWHEYGIKLLESHVSSVTKSVGNFSKWRSDHLSLSCIIEPELWNLCSWQRNPKVCNWDHCKTSKFCRIFLHKFCMFNSRIPRIKEWQSWKLYMHICSPLWAFLDLHTSFLPSSIFSTGVQCPVKPTTWVCIKISHLHIMSELLPAILLLFRFQNTKKNLSKSWVAQSQSNLTSCNKLFWRLWNHMWKEGSSGYKNLDLCFYYTKMRILEIYVDWGVLFSL
jgi:hypothetical protein